MTCTKVQTKAAPPHDALTSSPRHYKAYEASSEKEIRDEASCRLANGTASNRTTARDTVQSVILIAGATGNVGRHIASQLLDTGSVVRALTRNPESAGLPSDVGGVRGDLSLPVTLAVCLLWPFCTTAPSKAGAVTKRGRRIVYLSSEGMGDGLEQQTDKITALDAAKLAA